MNDSRIATPVLGVLLSSMCLLVACPADAADWPTWRYDKNRSAATTEELPREMHLQWRRLFPATRPAWPEDPRLQFDGGYEPIVAGGLLFVASSRNDSVTAFDSGTGVERWRFYADGPVRFAPVASQGRIYFGADDGKFYCLNGADGKLLWSFRAAPNERKVLGNARLTSVWPMRGGPVLDDGKLYFTIGVWPFEGTFLYTLDAATGDVVATGPASSSGRTQPEANVTTLKDLTPQGYLAASGSKLFIPCGRTVAACLDRSTGEFLKFSYRTYGTTNYHVSVIDDYLFHGTVCYDVGGKQSIDVATPAPVFTNRVAYVGNQGKISAFDLKNPKVVESKDRRGKAVKKTVLPVLWELSDAQIHEVPADKKTADKKTYVEWLADNPLRVDMKAGSRIYGHQAKTIFAVDLPKEDKPAAVAWTKTIDGTPSSMLAAGGKLYVVTREGRMLCFGPDKIEPTIHPAEEAIPAGDETAAGQVTDILNRSGVRDGYCLVLGVKTGGLVDELLSQSKLQLIVVDPDAGKIEELRRRWDKQGVYGTRVSAHVGDPANFGFPPYLANLVVSEDPQTAGIALNSQSAGALFRTLRPYGGKAFLPVPDKQHDQFAELIARSKLPNAEVRRVGSFTTLTRVGALPGSADWTHEYGDASNTLMSRDELVKAPFGVLWFGGPAAGGELFYNRHFWGPSMAVIGGRMFIQGPGKLTAVDVYTGRILWKTPLEDDVNYKAGRRGNDFEKVLAGYHFLAMQDGIYLVNAKKILRFDPATGKLVSEFNVPAGDGDWGRIRAKDDLLIASVFRNTKKFGKLPVELVAMNRHSGKVLWTHTAALSFPVVAVAGDKVFCYDGALEEFYQDWKRRGLVPKAAADRFVKAIDIKTGKELWKYSTDMVATWLSYSEQRDVLMMSNKKIISAFRGKTGAELWKKYAEGRGFKGHPENLWDKIILWNDRVIDQRGPGLAYNLETGESMIRRHPITNQPIAWEFTKSGHHCNYAIASPHLLTFRAATGGFCDLASGNTSRLEGFRSGCRNSLIPANGVLNAPNFAHGCVCGFPLFTSLALTHLPQSEMWSYSALKLDQANQPIERVGINFGAPGDRLAANGTLWLDYPNVGGSSPAVAVTVKAEKPRYFRQHSSFVRGGDLKWVSASGVEGISAVTIALNPAAKENRPYTVRLHFNEPDDLAAGKRVFDVAVQGKSVLENFDVVKETGGRNRGLVKEFRGIKAGRALTIALTPTTGRPVLGGVEIVAERQPER